MGFNSILQAIHSATQVPTAAPAPLQPTGVTVEGVPVPQINAPVQAAAQRPGILGLIGEVLSPQPGSYWYAAQNNPNGIRGARGAQQAYLQNQTEDAHKNLMAQASEAEAGFKLAHQNDVQIGNAMAQYGSDGKLHTTYEAPNSEEKMFELFQSMPDGPDKEVLRTMLRGAQYDPTYQGMLQDLLTKKAVTTAQARAKATAANRAPKAAAKPPAGFVLNP